MPLPVFCSSEYHVEPSDEIQHPASLGPLSAQAGKDIPGPGPGSGLGAGERARVALLLRTGSWLGSALLLWTRPLLLFWAEDGNNLSHFLFLFLF